MEHEELERDVTNSLSLEIGKLFIQCVRLSSELKMADKKIIDLETSLVKTEAGAK